MIGSVTRGDFSPLTGVRHVLCRVGPYGCGCGGGGGYACLQGCGGIAYQQWAAGVAGDFAPTLFAGCLAGWLFATCAGQASGISLPVCDFAFIGMAGVMSGAIGAPLMAMFLTAEMSGCYVMLLPLAAGVGSVVAYCARADSLALIHSHVVDLVA